MRKTMRRRQWEITSQVSRDIYNRKSFFVKKDWGCWGGLPGRRYCYTAFAIRRDALRYSQAGNRATRSCGGFPQPFYHPAKITLVLSRDRGTAMLRNRPVRHGWKCAKRTSCRARRISSVQAARVKKRKFDALMKRLTPEKP